MVVTLCQSVISSPSFSLAVLTHDSKEEIDQKVLLRILIFCFLVTLIDAVAVDMHIHEQLEDRVVRIELLESQYHRDER
jgi:hypothetical protein